MSILVSSGVAWILREIGESITSAPECGLEEHKHSEDCYTNILICGLGETTQEEQTSETEIQSTDEQDTELPSESESEQTIPDADIHTHSAECYKSVLICEKEEHTHSVLCYSDTSADTETKKDWEKTLPGEIPDDWNEAVVAVAKSQIGYTESVRNFKLDDNGVRRGYTRYGEWYGNPYGEWSGMFVSFCLSYAGIPKEVIPYASGCFAWQTQLKEAGLWQDASYAPVPGDIVLFDGDGNGQADRVGIVEEIDEQNHILHTVEGDADNCVSECLHNLDDIEVIGFCSVNDAVIKFIDTYDQYAVFADNQEETEIDFKNYITGVTVSTKKHEWDQDWTDIEAGSPINITENSKIKFDIAFSIPAEVLTGHEMSYQLPDGIKISKTSSGTVYASVTHEEIGSYTVSTDGKITITYNDDFYNKSHNLHEPINGHIAVAVQESEIKSDDTGKADLGFKDGLNLEVHVTDKVIENDLTVEKTQGTPNNENGTVTFTIKVSSKNGTVKPVHLTDEITKHLSSNPDLNIDSSSIRITKKEQNVSPINSQMNGTMFSMDLPQMSAGDVYEITYTAKLNSLNFNGTVNYTNKATAESERNDGAKLHGSGETHPQFTVDHVRKSGIYNASDNTVTWTVVVNEVGVDIGGWTLSDQMNGSDYRSSNVTVSPAINGQTSISLPYEFPDGTNGTYTITYTTPAEREFGTQNVSNKVLLTPPSGSPAYEGNASVWINTPQYNPLQKTGHPVETDETGSGTILWTTTVDANEGAIPPGWVLEDNLETAGMWFTAQQIRELETAVRSAANAAGITGVTIQAWTEWEWHTLDKLNNEKQYKAYSIKFDQALEKGKILTFNYHSTVNLEGLPQGETKIFRNGVNINAKVWDAADVPYTPVRNGFTIKKVDNNGGATEVTRHNYYDSNLKKDGVPVLEWLVTVKVPDGYTGGAATFTESLPEGVKLVYLESLADGNNGIVHGAHDLVPDINTKEIPYYGSEDYFGYSTTVTTVGNAQHVEVTIPDKILTNSNLKEIRFLVRVEFDEDYVWSEKDPETGKPMATFPNTATISSGDSSVSASQTQIVVQDDGTRRLGKSVMEQKDNLITYQLKINPNGEDLAIDSDILKLRDVLHYTHDPNDSLNVSLVNSSVAVYYMKPDGTKGDKLLTAEFPFTYETKNWLDGGNYHAEHSILMQIPDEKPLILEYKYAVSGKVGKFFWTFENKASLEGVEYSEINPISPGHVKIVDSLAESYLDGLALYKHDKDNVGLALQGAEFDLYHWDASQNKYVKVEGSPFKTGSDGYVTFPKLEHNHAYYFVETKAPEGYQLDSTTRYFYIYCTDSDHLESKPPGFKGEQYLSGGMIYHSNERTDTEITVKKEWQDKDGNPLEAPKQSVEFKLFQKAELLTSASDTCRVSYGVTVYGTKKFDGSLKCPKGSKVTLHFTIPEECVPYSAPETLQIEINDQLQDIMQTAQKNIYEYSFDVTYDTLLNIDVDCWQIQNGISNGLTTADKFITYESPPTAEIPELPDNLRVKEFGTYSVGSGDGWVKTIDNLPKKGEYTASDGTEHELVYSYYIEEVGGEKYDVKYLENNGITYGVITMINTADENSEAYELPETGGVGTIITTIGGAMLVISSAASLLYKKRRRGKEMNS